MRIPLQKRKETYEERVREYLEKQRKSRAKEKDVEKYQMELLDLLTEEKGVPLGYAARKLDVEKKFLKPLIADLEKSGVIDVHLRFLGEPMLKMARKEKPMAASVVGETEEKMPSMGSDVKKIKEENLKRYEKSVEEALKRDMELKQKKEKKELKPSIQRDNKKIITCMLLYLLALGTAEAVMAYYSMEFGLIIHTMILLFLIIFSYYVKEERYSKLMQSLALPSLIRILATSMPLLVFLNPMYQFLLIYPPLLLAAFLLFRGQKMNARDVGITGRKLWLQILVGLTGLIFGVMEYSILGDFILDRYAPGLETSVFGEILVYIFILLFFIGFTEELIFRGIILTNATKIFSAGKSIIFVSVIFMLMHMVFNSQPVLLFAFAVSLFYGYVFLKTRSVVGVSLSHGITNVMAFIVLPLFCTPLPSLDILQDSISGFSINLANAVAWAFLL